MRLGFLGDGSKSRQLKETGSRSNVPESDDKKKDTRIKTVDLSEFINRKLKGF